MYYGLFFDSNLFNSKLKNKIDNPHITFLYEKSKFLEIPAELLNRKAKCQVIGYSNNGRNEGYLVELLDSELLKFYKGAEQMHITIGLSDNAKAVDTCNLEFMHIKPFVLDGWFDIQKIERM